MKRKSHDTKGSIESALLGKLISSRFSPAIYDSKGQRKAGIPPIDVINATSSRIAGINDDVRSIIQMLPDIELVSQVLVSSIASPKDLGMPKLNFSVGTSFSNTELGGKLIKPVSEYFTNTYKINSHIPTILKKILFTQGAYIRLVLPESSLDAIINENGRITMESLSSHMTSDNTLDVRPLNILADLKYNADGKVSDVDDISLESMVGGANGVVRTPYSMVGGNPYITITDNPEAIKVSSIMSKMRKGKVDHALESTYVSMEARYEKKKASKEKMLNIENKSDREVEDSLRKHRSHTAEQVVSVEPVDDDSRKDNIGHPMVMILTSESVIPVYVSSNPEEHIGYFVILDQYGNPINSSSATDHYRDLQASFSETTSTSGGNTVSQVLNEMRGSSAMGGSGDIRSISQATEAFSSIVETDLLKRLRKGLGNSTIELGRVNAMYQIMLARACQQKQTQMLYVPSELMSYIAFDYSPHGVGKSLLENTRILGGIRATMLIANTIAAIRNSVQRTHLKIELDPNDVDPMSSIDQIKDAYVRSRASAAPIGAGDPSAIMDHLNEYGIDVVFSGHPDLPEMSAEAEDIASNRTMVDSDLMESLRDQHSMAMGVPPEIINTSKDVDFATTIVSSNLLLSKRVAVYQAQYEPQEAEFIKMFVKNSGTMFDMFYDIIEANGDTKEKEDVVKTMNEFIDSIEVSLPKPDEATLDSQISSYEKYSSSLDVALDAWISSDFALQDYEGDLSGYMDELRAAVKAYFLRKWLRDNNVFPELEILTELDDKKKPVFNFDEHQNAHMETLFVTLEDYIKKAEKATAKRVARMEAEEAEEEEVETETAGEGGSEVEEETPPVEEAGEEPTEEETTEEEPEAGGDDIGGDELGDLSLEP